MDCATAGTLRQCRATDHHWTGPVQPGLFALQGIPSRGRKANPIPGRIFQHHQSPQLRPAQHEYFFVAYDSRRYCGSDYRNGDDGAADTIGPEAHLLTGIGKHFSEKPTIRKLNVAVVTPTIEKQQRR